MRPRDSERAKLLDAALSTFDGSVRPLPGIATGAARAVLIEQLIESCRRIEFVKRLTDRDISKGRTDPTSDLFDPVRAAAWYLKNGNIDEACWLVFLSVHFGKNRKSGWALSRAVYSGRQSGIWHWGRVLGDPSAFRKWLAASQADLKGTGAFGNHRKYQSLDAFKATGTGAAVESYVKWVSSYGSHGATIDAAKKAVGSDPRHLFDWLYTDMEAVVSFGRMARFDYLSMLGKLGLAPIEPGSTYMNGATGPRDGAALLFGETPPTAELDSWLVGFGDHLGVGMQVVEDALCNWQKSPTKFIGFRG